MDPATVDAGRKTAAHEALAAVLDSYPDVFGPSCWCPGDDYCEGSCPSIPGTVSRASWVLALQFSDLDPAGKESLVFVNSQSCTRSTAVGVLAQGVRFFGG